MPQAVPGNFSVRTRTFLLLPLRLFLGCFLVLSAYDKWAWEYYISERLKAAWAPAVKQVHWATFRSFLTDTVLPHSNIFGAFLIAAEFVIGALLIIGLWVRLASLLGMAISAVYVMVLGYGIQPALGGEGTGLQFFRNPEQFGLYGLMFLLFLLFFLTGAGRSFGLDGMVWRRRARRLTQVAEQSE